MLVVIGLLLIWWYAFLFWKDICGLEICWLLWCKLNSDWDKWIGIVWKWLLSWSGLCKLLNVYYPILSIIITLPTNNFI